MSNSIEQRAVNYAGDRSQGAGHGYPSWEARLIEKGYIKGAKDQAKLMFSNKEVYDIFHEWFCYQIDEDVKEKLSFKQWLTTFKKKTQ